MEMLENKKRLYYKPEIVMIVLDNEISLALEVRNHLSCQMKE